MQNGYIVNSKTAHFRFKPLYSEGDSRYYMVSKIYKNQQKLVKPSTKLTQKCLRILTSCCRRQHHRTFDSNFIPKKILHSPLKCPLIGEFSDKFTPENAYYFQKLNQHMPLNCSTSNKKRNISNQFQPTQEVCQHTSGPSTSSGLARNTLPDDIAHQIRQVDEQPSTLTSKGLGSTNPLARIINRKTELINTANVIIWVYKGNIGQDIRVTQLIEIFKKPGQSLGLYLCEGNAALGRTNGVFVTRLDPNLKTDHSDLIKPGDEILFVNNACVKDLQLDAVVYALSTTKRLLLTTSYFESGRQISTAAQQEKPVVRYQRSTESDQRRDSEASSSGIISKPIRTADTWVGQRVQQELENQHNLSSQGQAFLTAPSETRRQAQPYRIRQPPIRQKTVPSSTTEMPLYNQRQQQQSVSTDQNRNEPELIRRVPTYQAWPRSPYQQRYPYCTTAPLENSVYRPPQNYSPALYPRYNPQVYPSHTMGRYQQPSLVGSAPIQRRYFPGAIIPSPFYSPYSQRLNPGVFHPQQYETGEEIFEQRASFHGNPYTPSTYAPKPYGMISESYKSNSLPRRRPSPATVIGGGYAQYPQRTVKWRNDVIGSDIADVMNSPYKSSSAQKQRPMFGRSAMSDVEQTELNETDIYPNGSSTLERNRLLRNQRVTAANWLNDREYAGTCTGKTIADIFSAQEYRNWADPELDYNDRRSRWTADRMSGSASIRSSSLPSKAILEKSLWHYAPAISSPYEARQIDYPSSNSYRSGIQKTAFDSNTGRVSNLLDRLHVSPLVNRRVPLQTAGPGFDVDRFSEAAAALTGILTLTILEGKGLKVPDKIHSKSVYVVVEVNEIHRARTGITYPEQHFCWNERFDIDIYNASNVQFFIYAWHPELRHRFCHKGEIRLIDAFFIDQLTGQRPFALKLEPEGQLLVKIGFFDMTECYTRQSSTIYRRRVFGQSLEMLQRIEQSETPVVLTRLIREIESRGVDTAGLYYLSGAVERKLLLRRQLEIDSVNTDISVSPVPDINMLACLVKDFLRELPEPLILPKIYSMLIEAIPLINPADMEGNQKLILKIIDCLPKIHKNTLILLMEHLKNLASSEPHNGLNSQRLTTIFGPLISCTAKTDSSVQKEKVDFLSVEQSASALKLLLDTWPRSTVSQVNLPTPLLQYPPRLIESQQHQTQTAVIPEKTMNHEHQTSTMDKLLAQASDLQDSRQPIEKNEMLTNSTSVSNSQTHCTSDK